MIKFFSKLKKNRDGATAIEFSLLAMPYFLLIFGIIEISLMFTAESLLEGSTTMAARQIRTGAIQQSTPDAMVDAFRAELCSKLILIDCDDIVIEVQTLQSFNDVGTMDPVFNEEGQMVSQGFDPGSSSDRVLIRVAYLYTGMTPLVSTMLWGADSSRLMMSTLVLQTEPYDFAEELAEQGEI